jgi:hypothetical protein
MIEQLMGFPEIGGPGPTASLTGLSRKKCKKGFVLKKVKGKKKCVRKKRK